MLCHSRGATPSFRSAVARALAPPGGALHPVTWIHTRQLCSTHLDEAVKEMAAEAARALERKAVAGIRGGRPLKKPGLHYTLLLAQYHSEEGDTPGRRGKSDGSWVG